MRVKVKQGGGPYVVIKGTALADLSPDQIRRRAGVMQQKGKSGVYVATAQTMFKEGEEFTLQGADKLGKYSSQFLENLDASKKEGAAPKPAASSQGDTAKKGKTGKAH